MKSYLTRTPGGERKRREERENTNTNTPGPERANPERAREKKSGGRRTTNQTKGGGGGQKRLNKPNRAKPKAYLSTSRTKTYLKGGARMKIRDQWGLVNEKVHPQNHARCRDKAQGPLLSNRPCKRRNSRQQRIRCTI